MTRVFFEHQNETGYFHELISQNYMRFFMVLMEENTMKKLHKTTATTTTKTESVSSLKPVIHKNIP